MEILIPIIIGIVASLKTAFPKTSKYAPLISLFLGIVLGLGGDFSFNGALQGAIYGLGAVGLYSGTKHTIKVATS